MAAIAYSLLPLSGLIAFLVAKDPRVRFHGLQAIVVGTVWAGAIYVGSWLSSLVVRGVFVVGGLVWLALMATALFGLDVKLPGIGNALRRLAIRDRPSV